MKWLCTLINLCCDTPSTLKCTSPLYICMCRSCNMHRPVWSSGCCLPIVWSVVCGSSYCRYSCTASSANSFYALVVSFFIYLVHSAYRLSQAKHVKLARLNVFLLVVMVALIVLALFQAITGEGQMDEFSL